jgi:hypothetical protein
MKLEKQTLEFLSGKKFSNNLTIPYPYFEPIPNRVAFLTHLAKGKKVIHLGCLDHLPLIDDKIKRGQWLHKELTENCATCIGIDIDAETKAYVESKYGYSNIILGDFTKSKLPEISRHSWDYAILGEILEHIDNPVAYLEAIKTMYSDCLKGIIITVPNAWAQTPTRMANKSAEIINSDHRYWFTPYTLAKVVMRAGMHPEDIYFANRVPLSWAELVKRKVIKTVLRQEPKYNFTYASSIVVVAHLS